VLACTVGVNVTDKCFCDEECLMLSQTIFVMANNRSDEMALNSQCDSAHYSVTSTPWFPCSTANADSLNHSISADDSGYFTGVPKPAVSKLSFVENCVDLPALNLDASHLTCCDRIHTEISAGLLDSSAACISQSSIVSDSDICCECQCGQSDETSVNSTPDVVDWLTPTALNDVVEDCSFVCCSANISVCEELRQPDDASAASHVDFIGRLSCMPHIVAAIFRNVSDSDLCRY